MVPIYCIGGLLALISDLVSNCLVSFLTLFVLSVKYWGCGTISLFKKMRFRFGQCNIEGKVKM